jgi:nucleotide-binding universal stress UspA family protein
MYQNILITLETTPTDRAIIEHVKELAKAMGSNVTLLHVATGIPAQFHGPQAAGQEVESDRKYLSDIEAEFQSAGICTRTQLEFGDPVRQIIKWIKENPCDLVAMSTHGHHLFADILLGTTASRVQHNVSVPVLLLRAR